MPAHLLFLDLIILFILCEEQNHEAPHYTVSSNALPFNLPSLQIFSSVPCSQTLSVYVLPLASETNFRTHTEPQAKLY
jgi:hypothetical protein